MNVNDAADYLVARGYPCSAGLLRRLVARGLVRHYRGPGPRGRLGFSAAQLDGFLSREERGPGREEPARRRRAAARRVPPRGD